MDLIIAATLEELGDVSAMAAGRDVEVLIVGVGLVDAAARLSARLGMSGSAANIDRVIFVGTAGAFPGRGLAIGDVVQVRAASLTLSASGDSYVPAAMARAASAGVAFPGLRDVRASNRLGISHVPPSAEAIAEGNEVESMEVFAVLRVAELHGVPAGALLAISNEVGPNAHQEWRAHGSTAMGNLRARLPQLLASAT